MLAGASLDPPGRKIINVTPPAASTPPMMKVAVEAIARRLAESSFHIFPSCHGKSPASMREHSGRSPATNGHAPLLARGISALASAPLASSGDLDEIGSVFSTEVPQWPF